MRLVEVYRFSLWDLYAKVVGSMHAKLDEQECAHMRTAKAVRHAGIGRLYRVPTTTRHRCGHLFFELLPVLRHPCRPLFYKYGEEEKREKEEDNVKRGD